jgi:hypothetical protein
MEVCLRAFVGVITVALLSTSPGLGHASPRHPADDCLAQIGSAECHDEDGACDLHAGPGCLLRSSICFNTGAGDAACVHRGIEGVRVQRPLLGSARGDVARSVLDALVALGGSETKRSVSFADEPMKVCKTFTAFVPRKGRRTGRMLLATKTTADGASDVDRARLVCLPPDPTSDHAPPLSSGCRFEMDRDECEAHDGVFDEAAGVLQLPHCFCRTDDFGETCDHNPQCQGLCLAEDVDATSGTCSEFATTFSCENVFLVKGQAFSICID